MRARPPSGSGVCRLSRPPSRGFLRQAQVEVAVAWAGGTHRRRGSPHADAVPLPRAGWGSEPPLVQAALGQAVRLSCPGDTSGALHTRWQKDGQPVSSDRCVQHPPPGGGGLSDPLWGGRVRVGLRSPGAWAGVRLTAVLGSPELKPPFCSLRCRLQPDGSLVISPLRAEDAGTYSCGSRPGRDSPKIQLRVTGLCAPSPHGFSRAHGRVGWRGLSPGPCGGGTRVLPRAQASWWQGPRVPLGRGWRSCSSWASFLSVSPTGLTAHPSFHLPPRSSGLVTGGDTAKLSETETRHLAQTRDPSLGAGAGGPGAIASSHPWPRTR